MVVSPEFLVLVIFFLLVVIAGLIFVVWRQRPRRSETTARSRWDEVATRTVLAFGMVMISIIGVILLASITIINATPETRTQTAREVLTAVLPLLGTWVGTVMAYYFTRENYESATRSTFQLATARNIDEFLRSTSVQSIMLKFSDSGVHRRTLSDKPLEQARQELVLVKMLEELDKAGDAKHTKWHRIPVLDSRNRPLYVVHRSTINEFIAKQSQQGKSQAQIEAMTLNDLCNDLDFQSVVLGSVSVVGETATLSDVKEAMSRSTNCQDVMITRSATLNDEAIGWITNTDLEKASKV